MNYELAEELGNAGFECMTHMYKPNTPNGVNRPTAPSPSLNDLIKACGDKFEKLENFTSRWGAYGYPYRDDGSNLVIESGTTPEEAVARLWLALNKK